SNRDGVTRNGKPHNRLRSSRQSFQPAQPNGTGRPTSPNGGSPNYGDVDVADALGVGGAVGGLAGARVVVAEEGLTSGLRVGSAPVIPAETLMPAVRNATATRARSSRPTSNCFPGCVRATIRMDSWSISRASTPITEGGSSSNGRSFGSA